MSKKAFWMPFKENIDDQCYINKNTYSPAQSVHSLSDMDNYYNLSSSNFPPSPQDCTDLGQGEANTLLQDLACNLDAFISTPGPPNIVHIITHMGLIMG